MSLDKATVARIARLARLEVPDDQLETVAGELRHILAFVEQLNEVNTQGVEPMTAVVEMNLRMRPDKVTEGGDPEKVLANAPERAGNYFVVPKVVE
jgi:aspartyl-tRNA(Asn)/glutamyl-tRNA(Gln) amidotransferase subunit C